MAKDIGKVISTLSQREIDILYRRMVKGETQREIGKDLGITGCRVGSLESRALRRLRAPIYRGNGVPAYCGNDMLDYPEFFNEYTDKNSVTSYFFRVVTKNGI